MGRAMTADLTQISNPPQAADERLGTSSFAAEGSHYTQSCHRAVDAAGAVALLPFSEGDGRQ
jgi:hypothetical protein